MTIATQKMEAFAVPSFHHVVERFFNSWTALQVIIAVISATFLT